MVRAFRRLPEASDPADLNPSWYGHSVGHWEGDTLVVDTVGFNDLFWFDFVGHPHTEQLSTPSNTLLAAAQISTPSAKKSPLTTLAAYTKPFTIQASHRLLPGDELMEYICQENNRDVRHLVGPAGRP